MSVLKTVARRYLEVPQLITPSAFQEIAELLDMRKGREALQEYFKPKSKEEKLAALMSDPFYSGYRFSSGGDIEEEPEDYGVIKVEGPLTYKPEMAMCAPETCNYQDLIKQTESLIAKGKKRILMIHDSEGGTAFSMMSSARQIRKLADDNGVELIGYVDGLSASASYGLLCICDKIVSATDSSIGSIGVVISLLNNSGALDKAGYKRSFITAGASKVPFDDEGDFKPEFLAKLQDDVNDLYEKFVNHVNDHRSGMTVESIKGTEAKVFRAEEALELGLIDEIMDVAEFKEKYLNSESSTLSTSNINHTLNKVNAMSEKTTIDMAAFEAMQAELAQYKAAAAEQALTAKTNAIKEKLASATFLSNMDAVVANLVEADEGQAQLLTSIISDASAALVAQKEEAKAAMDAFKTEMDAKVAELSAEKEKISAEAEKIREEFAAPSAIRDEEKEENLQELGHKEKLARAVAAAKAKQAH